MRLRILGGQRPYRLWLDRQGLSPKALADSLEEIKMHLSNANLLGEHFVVVADNGVLYNILWRTPNEA